MKHLSTEELERGLVVIRESPKQAGKIEMIVRRPRTEQREVLESAQLSVDGLRELLMLIEVESANF